MYNIFVSSTHLQIARPILLSLGNMSNNQELTMGYLIGIERVLRVAVERKSCEAEIETAFEFNTALVNKRRKDTTRGIVIELDLGHDFFTYLVNVS